VKAGIDRLEGVITAIMNRRSSMLKGQKQAIPAERPPRSRPRERDDGGWREKGVYVSQWEARGRQDRDSETHLLLVAQSALSLLHTCTLKQ